MAYDYSTQEALGESEVFFDFQQRLGRVAKVDRPVLVIGERGSGKELAAARLHYLSNRWNQRFVALNCAALPQGLIETELFGYEPGAFTGADTLRKGRFEEGDGGTLFLDEIGLIPLEVQEKILRVVEYGTFQRVGSSQSIEVNVRIVGATNQNLPELCENGLFKQDLLDRLSFEVLFIPPLRERGSDILLLARYFAGRMSRELGRRHPATLSDAAVQQILDYSWPGNIRELKNAVERAVYREDGPVITRLTLNPFRNPWEEESETSTEDVPSSAEEVWPINLTERIREIEMNWLKKALEASNGHQGKAAELLGLSYNQFRGLFRKYSKNIMAE